MSSPYPICYIYICIPANWRVCCFPPCTHFGEHTLPNRLMCGITGSCMGWFLATRHITSAQCKHICNIQSLYSSRRESLQLIGWRVWLSNCWWCCIKGISIFNYFNYLNFGITVIDNYCSVLFLDSRQFNEYSETYTSKTIYLKCVCFCIDIDRLYINYADVLCSVLRLNYTTCGNRATRHKKIVSRESFDAINHSHISLI